MTYLSVYISEWQDVLDAADDGHDVGTPVRKSPYFLPSSLAYNKFFSLAEAGDIDAVPSDWGASVAKVDKRWIQQFFERVNASTDGKTGIGCLNEAQKELLHFINSLDESTAYAIVASEL